jgi:hypothetical protein
MAKYPRTQRRPSVRAFDPILKLATALTLLSIFLAVPISAQNGKSGGNSPQAVLHIRVHVVPAIMPPRHREGPLDSAVTYNLDTQQTSTEVIDTTRELPGSSIGGNSGTGSIVLHTLTVVPK